MHAKEDCFALLDDSSASDLVRRSRLYTRLVRSLSCTSAADFPRLLDAMHQGQTAGLHAVALFSFELGATLQGITEGTSGQELAQVLLFADCQKLSAKAVDAWLIARAASEGQTSFAGITQVSPSEDEAAFTAAIAEIHRAIAAGETYQVNYTYRLNFAAYGGVVRLYQRLKKRQPVPFGALINLPDGRAVLSFSPELAIQHQTGELLALPMKGTAAASDDVALNAANAQQLALDPKNRAENVMIVDLLRNDLGRVAIPGSVQVPELFQVARYGDVLQMTSTVKAQVAPNRTLLDVLTAVLPCGSVTGAPKRRTLEIIQALEASPRGYYTGALGWFDAPEITGGQCAQSALGDFCLSVPIRTLVLDKPQPDGQRRGIMGVGAGIVQDSMAKAEFLECGLKAQFLTGLPHEFELFETLLASDVGCPHLELHMQRLAASAAYFGFIFDAEKIRKAIHAACVSMGQTHGKPHRLRLTLSQGGQIATQFVPLQPLAVQEGQVRVLVAKAPVKIEALFLRHKTTYRAAYDAAWRAAEAAGAFDMLFFNAHGELTEGARSNVFIQQAGLWYTPPLACGLLPGVMRQIMLNDATWSAREKVLTMDDLRTAEAVVVCNALRGALPAKVVWPLDSS
ncbi:MAG TPA: bifunctional anthranilate synthase component I family protein/class IV aminotransferase [Rugosibacter sp.]|nr:bifunctional anthranilate synthase component I family protein/class IV aminotransferase [Rugosibacter sp.]